ncbi:hypothetical protein [Cloacibacillus evryensis]|uniref:hypothetical protein n=1 Tax=Cloacibacillus evryensis TaxID=508460 RepID=UPI00210CE0E2|nr:hypothetical protein [Cloacibacillus evryensis]MCQ4763424.1 hypothetical protein [Cloacibacillus evryensis]
MDDKRIEELKSIAAEVRKDILRMVGLARSGPFETSISAADLLVYLYWEELLLVPAEPRREDRDRFVTDIPAAVPALYAVLARRGFFEREHLWHYRRLGAMLQALPDFKRTPGIDAPCLAVQPAVAMAAALAEELAGKEGKPRVVFLTADLSFESEEFIGEMKYIGRRRIPNLLTVIASRGAEADGGSRISEDNMETLSSCGWRVRRAVSEDFRSLEEACDSFDYSGGGPKALFVSTVGELGLSVSDAGRSEAAHSLSMSELDQALEELEVKSNGH